MSVFQTVKQYLDQNIITKSVDDSFDYCDCVMALMWFVFAKGINLI